jgi:hypothetical protein
LTHVANVYPHHDLLNVVFYHYELIQQKSNDSTSEAIAIDCISCLIALSIGVEGLINFCGDKIVENWKERQAYHKKLKQTADALKIEFDESAEPFSTLALLKTLRDDMVHPKPIERKGKVTTKEELNKLMETTWDPYCNYEFVQHAFNQVNAFEQLIYAEPDIQKSGILTGASGWGKIDA